MNSCKIQYVEAVNLDTMSSVHVGDNDPAVILAKERGFDHLITVREKENGRYDVLGDSLQVAIIRKFGNKLVPAMVYSDLSDEDWAEMVAALTPESNDD